MADLPNVVFRPWKGERYGRESRFGVRLLVLGESHYGECGTETSDFTTAVVREWAQTHRHAFFTVISKILLCKPNGRIDNETRGEVWNHVAFYNFVQSFVGDRSRIRPNSRQWIEAQAPFKEVLHHLQPDAVLVLGYRLGEHILDFPVGVEFEVIGHPSSYRMRYDKAIPSFEGLIARAKARVSSA